MARETKLVIGGLLLSGAAIMGLILLIAPPPLALVVALAFLLPFLVPGLIFLTLGIRRGLPAELDGVVDMKLVPSRIGVGLGAVAVSVLLLVAMQNIAILSLPKALTIFAFVGVPVGLMIAGTAWTEVCAVCRNVLTVEPFETELRGGNPFKAVITATPDALARRLTDSKAPAPESRRAMGQIAYCRGCATVARVPTASGTRWLVGDEATKFLGARGMGPPPSPP